MSSVAVAIAEAEALLPGTASPDGESDPRWQAIIAVSEFLPEHPLEVWAFAQRWGSNADPDLQAAIATCLVEHLLEEHFELLSPLVIASVAADAGLHETVAMCWLPDELASTEAARQMGVRARYA